jgi:DNA-binding MurR/RpiR family transcriptional regulator
MPNLDLTDGEHVARQQVREIARSYNVSHSTISRLTARE